MQELEYGSDYGLQIIVQSTMNANNTLAEVRDCIYRDHLLANNWEDEPAVTSREC